MKTAAIIAEYNPFHNGHKYQIDQLKNNLDIDNIVAIISGNYVQRGDMSIIDKYTKTEFALKNGIDLIIELPFVYSCSSAEIFASSAVRILDSLGIINFLCFGMENVNHLDKIKHISSIMINETNEYKTILKSNLNKGNSFIKARNKALEKITCLDLSFLNNPNNILACEYIKELLILNSNIEPYPINRTISYTSSKSTTHFLSASGIRSKMIHNEEYSKFIPNNIAINKSIFHYGLNKYFDIIKNKVLAMNIEDISNIPDVEVGLDHRIYNNIYNCSNIDDLINNVSTKRYTKSRIRRILTHILTGYTKEEFFTIKNYTPSFIKILGFTDNGRKLIKNIKNNNIKIYTNYDKSINKLNVKDKIIIDRNIKSDNIYNIGIKRFNNDFYEQPIYLKK